MKFAKFEHLLEKLQGPRFQKTEPFNELAEYINSQTRVARENAQKYELLNDNNGNNNGINNDF